MRLGTIHQKKRVVINKIKIFLAGLIFSIGNKRYSDFPSAIKTVVLIHNNKKLGDLIVFSAIYRELKSRNISLTIITDPKSADFLKHNSKIDCLIVKDGDDLKDIIHLRRKLKKHYFDLAIDPFETIPNYKHVLLLSSIRTTHYLGFDKWYSKYYHTYDNHNENLKHHISTRVLSVIQYIDKRCTSVCCEQYDLPLPGNVVASVKEFLDDRQLLIINPYGAKKICRLSDRQIIYTYDYLRKKYPQSRIIFTGMPDDLALIPIPDAELSPFKTFSETVVLTKYATILVSVDTALIHVATAFSIPTVALYPKPKRANYPSVVVWGPNSTKAVLAVSQGYYVNELPNEKIREAIDKLS